MLQVVPDSVEPWKQLTHESEDEFLYFLSWLHGEREIPTHQVAVKNSWAARAKAFDERLSVPLPTDRDGAIRENFRMLAYLGSRKLIRREQGSDEINMSVRDLVTVMAFLDGQDTAGGEAEIDWSKISDSEFDIINQITQKGRT